MLALRDHLYLANQWRRIHRDGGAKLNWLQYRRILKSYSAPDRYYHTIRHLIYGLRFMDQHFADEQEQWVARLAYFFHDVEYDTHAAKGDNEYTSSACLAQYGTRQGFASAMYRGTSLIINTMDHQHAVCVDLLWPMINDSDLAIFSTDYDTYLQYAQNVFKEYKWVGVEKYIAGRSEFLQQMLKRPIFLRVTQFEAVARKNIAHELALLSTFPERITNAPDQN